MNFRLCGRRIELSKLLNFAIAISSRDWPARFRKNRRGTRIAARTPSPWVAKHPRREEESGHRQVVGRAGLARANHCFSAVCHGVESRLPARGRTEVASTIYPSFQA
jgi:hypothetical protein